MATLEELVVRIEADNKKLTAQMLEANKATERAMKAMEGAVEKFSHQGNQSMSRFSRIMDVFVGVTLANVARSIANFALSSMGQFVGALKGGVAEAIELEKANVRLANSLALSGNFTEKAMKQLRDFTNEMERKTGVDDSVIASNLAVLSSLTRLDSEGLMNAQKSALDLSAALGIDLNTATNLVAKAANGNVSALSRYGIQIQTTGDRAKDGANALKILEQRFGGAAQGAMQTFGGALKGAQNSVGNFLQSLGNVIVKNPVVIKAIQGITEIFNELTDWATRNAPQITKAVASFFIFVIDSAAFVTRAIDSIVKSFSFLINLVSTRSLSKAMESFSESTFLEKFADRLNDIGYSAREAANKIGESTDTVVPTLKNQTQVVRELTAAEEARNKNLVDFANKLISSSQSISESYNLQSSILKAQYDADIINFQTYRDQKLAMQEEMMMSEMDMLIQAREQRLISQEQFNQASEQLAKVHGAAQLKTQTEIAKQEEALNKQRLQAFSGFFGNLASLQKTGSKELFAIGKAAAIAQATIDGYAAIQGAYKSGAIIGGPPLGAAFAAAAGIATAVNLSKIAATGLRSGINSVPGVGTKDNFPAMLAPGERVVPTKTNEDLTRYLEERQNEPQQQLVFNLNFHGPVWADKATAGSEIIEAINEAFDRGMGLRLRQA